MNWLSDQINDSKKRERLFKIMNIISQGMLILGIVIIIYMFKEFLIIKQLEYVLEKQSIMNWLNNTCNKESGKNEILQRHHNTSNHYKSLVHYEETSKDIFVNIKHMLVLGQKRLSSR